MGRYYFNAKTTVEQATELSIFKLKEFDLLTGYCGTIITWTRRLSGHKSSIGICVDTEELYAKVNYTLTDRNTGEKTDYDYKIGLTTTPCNFGGVPPQSRIVLAIPSFFKHTRASIAEKESAMVSCSPHFLGKTNSRRKTQRKVRRSVYAK